MIVFGAPDKARKSGKSYSFKGTLWFQTFATSCEQTWERLRVIYAKQGDCGMVAEIRAAQGRLLHERNNGSVKGIARVSGVLALLDAAQELHHTAAFSECVKLALLLVDGKQNTKELLAGVARAVTQGGPFSAADVTSKLQKLCTCLLHGCKRGSAQTHNYSAKRKRVLLLNVKTKWMATVLANRAQERGARYDERPKEYLAKYLREIDTATARIAVSPPAYCRPLTPIDGTAAAFEADRRDKACTVLWRCTQYLMAMNVYHKVYMKMNSN